MQHKNLANPQTVNACTWISMAVIDVILNAKDEDTIENKIKEVHEQSQKSYIEEMLRNTKNLAHGEGVLETELYEERYRELFTIPYRSDLKVPIDDNDFDKIIANREQFLSNNKNNKKINEQKINEFYTFNLELIEAIANGVEDSTNINWQTITADELRRRKKNNTKSLKEKCVEIIESLNSQGITIRIDGHTISIVQRKNIYYSYDSLTGDLSTTNNLQEMADHLVGKITKNQAKGAVIYYFSAKKPALSLQNSKPSENESINFASNKHDVVSNEINNSIEQLYVKSSNTSELLTNEISSSLLINIIKILQDNILKKNNGRKTSTYASWKIKLLNEIKSRNNR